MLLPRPIRFIWFGAASAGLLAVISLMAHGAHIHLGIAEFNLVGFSLLAVVAHRYQSHYASAIGALIRCLHGIALFAAIGVATALSSYAIAQYSHGFADNVAAGADRAMGFDWLTLYRFEAGHDWAKYPARFAYGLIGDLQLLLILGLVLSDQEARLFRFVYAYVAVLSAALVIFSFMPMQSALAHHVGMHPTYMPCTGLYSPVLIAKLQAGTLAHVSIGDLIGIITFPSVHAAAAALYIWAGWSIRIYRWPMVILNLMMLAATPIEGAHYFSDVICGLLLAGAAIIVMTRTQSAATILSWRSAVSV